MGVEGKLKAGKMRTDGDSSVIIPPALLAELHAAADEEHREPEELVREAVSSYLENRRAHPPMRQANLADLLFHSPFFGAELDLERRKDYPRSVDL